MTKKNNYKRKRITRKKGNFKKKRTLKKHYKQNIKIRGGESNQGELTFISNTDEQSSHCDNGNELDELITKYTTASNASLTFPQLPTNESHEMLDLINKMKDEVDKISDCIQENTTYLERNKDQLLKIFKNAANAGLTEIVQKMVDSLITISDFKENFKLHAETDMRQRNIYKEAEDSMKEVEDSMNASNEKILSYYLELKKNYEDIIRMLDNIDININNDNII